MTRPVEISDQTFLSVARINTVNHSEIDEM